MIVVEGHTFLSAEDHAIDGKGSNLSASTLYVRYVCVYVSVCIMYMV